MLLRNLSHALVTVVIASAASAQAADTAAADLAALEMRTIQTVQAAKPSVVTIAVPYRHASANTIESAVLSGVVVKDGGVIVSLSNLLNGCDQVEVTYPDDQVGKARVLGYDPVYGLGVLKADRAGLKPLPMATAAPRAGSWVLMVGNSFGLSHSVSWGIVSGVRKGVQVLGRPPVDMIQMTAPVNPGDSGCAVLNLRGELVGLASTSYTGSQGQPGGAGISFAVPMASLRGPIEQILAKGTVARGWLGVGIITVYLPRSGRRAAQVVEVQPDSPGERSGLQIGDVILSFGRRPIRSAEELESEILLTQPDTQADLEIIRAGRDAKARVAVGHWRPATARPVGHADSLISQPQRAGAVRLSGARRDPRNAALRQRLQQMRQEILRLLKEMEP